MQLRGRRHPEDTPQIQKKHKTEGERGRLLSAPNLSAGDADTWQGERGSLTGESGVFLPLFSVFYLPLSHTEKHSHNPPRIQNLEFRSFLSYTQYITILSGLPHTPLI